MKLQLHSTGDASSLAALLLAQILPVFSVVAPCQRPTRLGATLEFHHGLLALIWPYRPSALNSGALPVTRTEQFHARFDAILEDLHDRRSLRSR